MVYKRLYIQVILRVALLLITCIALSRMWFSAQYAHASIVISGVLILEILDLIRYLNLTNRRLEMFFTSLFDSASSFTFSTVEVSDSFKKLGERLEEINRLLMTERIEKEVQHTYLNYLIENIGTGIITFKQNGKIDLINPAAKEIFAGERIRDLSSLNKFNPSFEESIKTIELKQKILIRVIVREELFYLTVQKSLFKVQEDPIWLISFQDINTELDKKELDAWQKVIRFLTHEIMSSISPVSSLSGHLLQKMQISQKPEVLTESGKELLNDIEEGLEIIKTRGEGLLNFVKHYHSLTHPPLPKFEDVELNTFLNKIVNLIKPECENYQVTTDLHVDEGLSLYMDPQLMEPVIINLIRNSIQALVGISTERKIWITASSDGFRGIKISVKDNGCGIDLDNMDNIFIPFYTTKEKGSGIGLSYTKQIIRLHNGQIQVKSELGKGAEFILKF